MIILKGKNDMAITKEQDNLIKIMAEKDYNAHTTAAISTFLKTPKQIQQMSNWIENNPQDNQEALNEMGRILRGKNNYL